MSLPYERICEYGSNLSSPFEMEGSLFLLSQSGEVINFKDGLLNVTIGFLSLLD